MKREKFDIRELTGNKLNDFKKQLEKEGPCGKALKPGAISNYLRAIRSLIGKAKDKYNEEDADIIAIGIDPFKKVKIPDYIRTRKNLPVSDIIRVRDGQFKTRRAQFARDVFMMQIYLMGINISDLYNQKSLIRGRFHYECSKTMTDTNISRFPISIRIEPELQILIDKYSTKGFLSNFRSMYNNSDNFMKAVNSGLKTISIELGFIPDITSNWARHSWASIARNKARISKADIDFCLGHVNNDYKMADIYIDIDYSICDDANRAVLDILK